MSDNNVILPNSFGSPYYWLFSESGEVLKSSEGVPLSTKLIQFEYNYNEESDDECTLKFQFENIKQLNEPFFKRNVSLKVQWGYIINNRKFLKSPIRTISIRNIKTYYQDGGIFMTLKCTDLVSYLKNVQTDNISDKDHFEDWLKEIIAGKFKATITIKGITKIMNKDTQQTFEYDYEKGIYRKAIDNTGVVYKDYEVIQRPGIRGGYSKAISEAIEDELRLSQDGPLYVDGRDDTINIKDRDFNRKVFKNFTFYGGSGEIIDFITEEDDEKVKEDIGSSSGVDPITKEIVDTSTNIAVTTAAEYFEKRKQEQKFKPTPQQLQSFYKQMQDLYEYNIKNPLNQKEVNSVTFKTVVNKHTQYMGRTATTPEVKLIEIPTKTILSSPEFNAIVKQNEVQNFMLDKIQRVRTAKLTIIGDPSMIVSRIININNVSDKDKGRWYITEAKHVLNPSRGYITELTLIQKPTTVSVVKHRRKGIINNEQEGISEDDMIDVLNDIDPQDIENFYDNLKDQSSTLNEFDDDSVTLPVYEGSDEVSSMENRLNLLNAENDLLAGSITNISDVDNNNITFNTPNAADS